MTECGLAFSVKVLFADDEENILKSLKRLFRDEPYEIVTARSGAEGLEILRKAGNVGVIVTDQRMPMMSGTEFLARARELAPEAFRIVLTGYADLHAVVDAINRGGAYRYAAKPWKDGELVQIVRDAVRQYVLLRENRRLEALVHRQNEELKDWNGMLEQRVREQTFHIEAQNLSLQEVNARLKKSFDDTLASFSGLLELRDPAERHHSQNVAAAAEILAVEAGLPSEEVHTVRVAALLHDIGKVGGTDLSPHNAAHAMTPADWRAYHEHPVRGQTVVDSIEALRAASVLIRHHHERWDGKGFPDGLRGAAIPVGARILALADCVDREKAKCRGENTPQLVLEVVHREARAGRLDLGLLPYAETAVPEVCDCPGAKGRVAEIELDVSELKRGMTLSRDALSGTGVLLLRAGTVLDGVTLTGLGRRLGLDPAGTGVFIYRDEGNVFIYEGRESR